MNGWYEKPDGSGQIMDLTLSDVEGHSKPYRGLNGNLRYFCPIHGSDRQRSFKLNQYTGHFKCYSCGAWGYIDEINKAAAPIKQETKRKMEQQRNNVPKIDIVKSYLEMYQSLHDADNNHIAVRYLKWRGIDHKTALRHGLGFAPWGKWTQYNAEGKLCRQWKRGRLVFAHTDPETNVINLYGRAIGADDVPKHTRHDHLNLPKGVFNCQALQENQVIITEGAFDALSLLQAGYNAAAIFGVRGFNTDWVKSNEIIFAFDQDEAGREGWRVLADQLQEAGKQVYTLAPEWYNGHNDIGDLWQAERAFKQLLKVKYLPQGMKGSEFPRTAEEYWNLPQDERKRLYEKHGFSCPKEER